MEPLPPFVLRHVTVTQFAIVLERALMLALGTAAFAAANDMATVADMCGHDFLVITRSVPSGNLNAVANNLPHLFGGDVHTRCHSSNSVQWQMGFTLFLVGRKLGASLPGTCRNGQVPHEVGSS